MKTCSVTGLALLTCCFLVLPSLAAAASLGLVSTLDSTNLSPITASGDSLQPVLSADGRYVLFASTANNLVSMPGNRPLPVPIPPRMNVFLRDRLNGTMALVSVNQDGTGGGNGNSWPVAISTNGQFVLFETAASDLLPTDTNKATDIILRDLVNGTNILISAATNGLPGNGNSRSPAMTPDGRFVAFVSEANNLVARDTNAVPDVFVRDVLARATVLASTNARSISTIPTGASEAPEISADGRYVAFYSTASNLVAGARSIGDVYVRDLANNSTKLASAGSRAALLSLGISTNNLVCFNHVLSADGQYIAYEACSNATTRAGFILRYNLATDTTELIRTNAFVPMAQYEDIHSLEMTPDGRFVVFVVNTNINSTAGSCVVRWDAQDGSSTIMSLSSLGGIPAGAFCDSPVMDDTGRYVAFVSSGNLSSDPLVYGWHVYARDIVAGSTRLLDIGTNGPGSGASAATAPKISADGRVIAFETADPTLVERDLNREFDVFVHELQAVLAELVSAAVPGLSSTTPNGPSSLWPSSVSASGQFVAFSTEASNLIPGDTNSLRDVFVRDLVYGTNCLVSMNTNGLPGDGISTEASISADGRSVAFTSFADDLVLGDTNRALDVFVRDLQAGTTTLVSASANNAGFGNRDSFSPRISADGHYVLFHSRASNLSSGTFSSGTENLFFRDVSLGTNYALTTTGVAEEAMSPDGRWVAYLTPPASAKLYLWDSSLHQNVYTNATSTISDVTLSPDGRRLAFWAGSGALSLWLVDPVANTGQVLASATQPLPHEPFCFSADGRFLAYLAPSNLFLQVYLYDVFAATNRLITQAYDTGLPVQSSAGTPVISPDGRWVAYRCGATNLVPADANGLPDVFLYDNAAGTTTLLSASRFGGGADNRSLSPVFSSDSRVCLFESWASDVLASDANHSSDLAAYTLYSSGIIPLFSAQIVLGNPGEGCFITWPVLPGRSYRVEFKENVGDLAWQDAGPPVITGNQGRLQEPAGANQRFYRVVAY